MKWVVALMLAAACSGTAPRTTPVAIAEAPTAKAGRAERFKLGAFEAYALSDGHLVVPNDATLLGVGHAVSEIADVLAAAGLPRDTIRLDIQCLLVKAGDRVLLFDTGLVDAAFPDAGHLMQSLALANVAAAAVTDILISHAHSDHISGLVTPAGALAFPGATIHMSAPEWTALRANTDAESKRFVAVIAGKVSTFEPGAQVLPIVKAVATPGHTPGHSSYEIGTGVDKLFYLGDVAHHSIISVQRPAWSIEVDADHATADALRQRTLGTLATDHTRVFAVHFPFPGIGRVVGDGQGLVWQPAP